MDRRHKVGIAAGASALVVGAALGLAPVVISGQIVDRLTAAGARDVVVEDVDLNLFSETAAVSGLRWTTPDGRGQSVSRLELGFALWPMLSRDHIALRSARLTGTELMVDLSRAGTIVLGGIDIPLTDDTAPDPEATGWSFSLRRAELETVSLAVVLPGLESALEIGRLAVGGLDTRDPTSTVDFDLQLAVDGAELVAAGNATPLAERPEIELMLELEGLQAVRYAALLPEQVTLEAAELDLFLDGRLILEDRPRFEAQVAVSLTGLSGVAQGVSVAADTISFDGELAGAATTTVEGALTGGSVRVARGEDRVSAGSLGWRGRLELAGTGGDARAVTSSQQLTVSDAALRIASPAIAAHLSDLEFDGDLAFTDGATTARGSLSLAGVDVDAVDHGALVDLARLDVTRATLARGGDLELQVVSLEELVVLGGEERVPLILSGARIDRMARRASGDLSFGVVELDTLVAELLREADGRLHAVKRLESLIASDGEAGRARTPPTVTVERLSASPGSLVRVLDRSGVREARLELAIEALQLTSMSSAAGAPPGRYRLLASVGEYGRLDLQGTGGLRAPTGGASISGTLEGLDLPQFAPYLISATGYTVQTGQMDAGLELAVTQGRLVGELDLTLERLNVESVSDEIAGELDQGIGMPLPKALDMLRDGDGRISFLLPLSGDVSDPEFDVDAVVRKATSSAIKSAMSTYLKLALQPFGVVSFIFGQLKDAAETELQAMTFGAGTSELDDRGRLYAEKLGGLLADRPKIRLDICGMAVPEDREALAAEAASSSEVPERAAPPTVPDQALRDLARARSDALRRLLVKQHAVDPGRLFVCDPQILSEGPPRIELAL